MLEVDTIRPHAALPGGEFELHGSGLGPGLSVTIGGVPALVILASSAKAIVKVPDGTLPGELIATRGGISAPPKHAEVAVAMAENLHPVANPAVDELGNVYATLSGSRGQQTPVSVFKIAPAPAGVVHELRPFVRDILNPTGLAFSPRDPGALYVSSRADGTVYRVSVAGEVQIFAEGLGVATGIAFDATGNLFIGDRSGTIFKIPVEYATSGPVAGTIFVFCTLEPSIAAYHLAFNGKGVLFVSGPTTSSSQGIYAIDQAGNATAWFRGLGRAQGMAFDAQDNLYVVASLAGDRGIIRITPSLQATLIVSGSNLVGLCLLPGNRAALATRDAVYAVHLD